jgi:hypothetical protein
MDAARRELGAGWGDGDRYNLQTLGINPLHDQGFERHPLLEHSQDRHCRLVQFDMPARFAPDTKQDLLKAIHRNSP